MTAPAPDAAEVIRELPLISVEDWARRRGTPFFTFASRALGLSIESEPILDRDLNLACAMLRAVLTLALARTERAV